MGPLQLTVKNYYVGEQATHLDIQNKENSSATEWKSLCFWCSPARCVLYHMTVSCKGPIILLNLAKYPLTLTDEAAGDILRDFAG